MMTQQKEEEHIVTAEEPAWTEQKHRPGEDGTPEVVPDTLILHPLDSGPAPRYSCSCGANFRNWGGVLDHFEEVENSQESNRQRSNTQQIADEQATLDDL